MTSQEKSPIPQFYEGTLSYKLSHCLTGMLSLRFDTRIPLTGQAELLAKVNADTSGLPDGFPPLTISSASQYEYPGSVRELQNIIERAAILCKGDEIQPEHIIIRPSSFQSSPTTPAKTPENRERDLIIKALEDNRWNRRQAAKQLDMPYSTLRYKMTQFGIS